MNEFNSVYKWRAEDMLPNTALYRNNDDTWTVRMAICDVSPYNMKAYSLGRIQIGNYKTPAEAIYWFNQKAKEITG